MQTPQKASPWKHLKPTSQIPVFLHYRNRVFQIPLWVLHWACFVLTQSVIPGKNTLQLKKKCKVTHKPIQAKSVNPSASSNYWTEKTPITRWDQDCEYFTRTRSMLAVHKSAGKFIRGIKGFLLKCRYVSNEISPFPAHAVRYHPKGRKAV